MKETQDFLELAKKASLSAGDLIMRKFGKREGIRSKSDRDLVTDADTQAEKLIISMIKKEHPDHSILAEESGESFGESGFTWVIDPLDGTNNFAYGIPLFGVAISLLKGKEPVLGVINIPVFGQLFHAQKGRGAFLNGKPARVSGRKELREILLLYDSDFLRKKEEVMGTLNRLICSVFKVRMLGAATIHYSQILQGNADLWLEHTTKPWDITGGSLMVEEAGGRVTDFDGNPWTPWSKNLVISNGKAHEEILEIING